MLPVLLILLGAGLGFAAYTAKTRMEGQHTCTTAEAMFVESILLLLKTTRTAPAESLRRAHEIAIRCYPMAATQLESAMQRLLLEKNPSSKAGTGPGPGPGPGPVQVQDKVKSLLLSPDLPPTAAVVNGKPVWLVKSGVAIPQVSAALAEFQSFQRAVGVNPDGRIGQDTLKAFVKVAKERGYGKYPQTVPALAANITKWGLIIHSGVTV